VYHVFSFRSRKNEPLEISPSCQDLVKDINLGNAAGLAVSPDIGPQYVLGELTTHTAVQRRFNLIVSQRSAQ
jgi:hypothetical protein